MITLAAAAILKGRSIIVGFEGRVLHPYLDNRPQHPIWTIGNGITTLLDGSPVGPHTPPLTPEESDALTDRKLSQEFVPAIERCVERALSVDQGAAVISLTWNIGIGAFERSNILRYINAGDFQLAGTHFRDYCHEEGQVSKPLLRRRNAEMNLFDEVGGAILPPIGRPFPKPDLPTEHAALTTDQLNAAELGQIAAPPA